MEDNQAGFNLAGLVPFVVGSILPIATIGLLKHYAATGNATIPDATTADEEANGADTDNRKKLLILYGTVTGTASEMATALCEDLLHIETLNVAIKNVKEFNEEDLDKQDIVLFLCCTWSEGSPPDAAVPFMTWLVDLAQDFRVSKNIFSHVEFTAFGLGSKVYGGKMFCKPVNTHN